MIRCAVGNQSQHVQQPSPTRVLITRAALGTSTIQHHGALTTACTAASGVNASNSAQKQATLFQLQGRPMAAENIGNEETTPRLSTECAALGMMDQEFDR
mmetsp:Transcript_135122/g.246508  ORF Transcript_135122/g.246508 Transcript_135122/m.246508 type:complete len:100 (-) Transcript_135122:67-366(-)